MNTFCDAKVRRIVTTGICSILIVVVFSSATVQSRNTLSTQPTKDYDLKPLKTTFPFFLRFFIHDWNWWDSKPNMFSITPGNIGVGTSNPLAKLDIAGNIAVNGKEIINASGIWVGEPTGLQGPPGDSRWGLNGNDTYYNNGSVGIGITSPLAKLQIKDGAVLFDGDFGTTPVSGGGTRLMWVPNKAAFRAGSTFGNYWDDANIGSHSMAFGFATKASEYCATAMGAYTTASGIEATAMGEYTKATGYASTAMGLESKAKGFGSTAMGFRTTASGHAATAMGNFTNASGESSTALGINTVAAAARSTAMGSGVIVNGMYSMGIGLNGQWPPYQINQSNILSIMGGNVGIGTTQPTAKLDVQGGNITEDGFPVCSFVGFVQQHGNYTAYSDWVDVPGVIINFTFLTSRHLELRAIGCVPIAGATMASFRFVVDGIPYGNPNNGDTYIGGTQGFFSWNIERIISLPSGNHTVRLQARSNQQFTVYDEDDTAAKLFVHAW